MTKTTIREDLTLWYMLWFAQNSLPLRWQRQPAGGRCVTCDVVICSKFITFAVTKTTCPVVHCSRCLLWFAQNSLPLRWQRQPQRQIFSYFFRCDLLKIHYLCGDKDNYYITYKFKRRLWFAQNSLPLRWQRQLFCPSREIVIRCDLLKIHYLCGDKDNINSVFVWESEECRMY